MGKKPVVFSLLYYYIIVVPTYSSLIEFFFRFSTNEQPLSDCWLIEFDPLLHETDCAWNSLRLTRLRSHEDPWFGVRFWHTAVKIPAEECVMVVGGYASHEPVNRPNTKHGDALLRSAVTSQFCMG